MNAQLYSMELEKTGKLFQGGYDRICHVIQVLFFCLTALKVVLLFLYNVKKTNKQKNT